MASRRVRQRLGLLCNRQPSLARPAIAPLQRRSASTEIPVAAIEPSEDVDPSSSFQSPSPPEEVVQSFDPIGRSRSRKRELPPSRYRFRPPKYYRGPLHPHQPPPPSDPSSRLFRPGPFSLPRLEQTYTTTIAPDLLTLTYLHLPPGFRPPPRAARLREWDDSSPYHKNRPARGPRGGDVLRLLKRPTNFRNVPKLQRVTIHCMVKGAIQESAYLHIAGMIVQAISGVRVVTHATRTSVAQWGLRANKHISVTAEIEGEAMYHFIGKCVDVVLPRIKDWKGVKGSSGDSSGNISFGITPEAMALFPEVEVNYDM
ncbi:MAG: hypothetical protein M1812_002271 [Candelaria pacifica]|nr:MAG: hypothetical protein M1812_002271 [Candelaria pacifica]